MTELGGWKKVGAVFLVCAAAGAISALAQTFTTLVYFGTSNGANPAYVSLVQGPDGNLYGTTLNGGNQMVGNLFRVTPGGTITGQYFFGEQMNSGTYPWAGLVLAGDGNFYGATSDGGADNGGTIFKVSASGKLATLYTFCSQAKCTDGLGPEDALIQGGDGNFYGTTSDGGTSGFGTIFRVTPGGALTTLYSFCPQGEPCLDGQFPVAGLVQAADGAFYGTTTQGGYAGNNCKLGCGTVFRVTASGRFTTLHTFDGTDGRNPYAALLQAADGNLYGTTYSGGSNLGGTVFKITPSGELTTLYNFCAQAACADGEGPQGALVQATGNFYGTTSSGGTGSFPCLSDCGTVFELTAGGLLTTLHQFRYNDGDGPTGGLLQATNGTFYGTTSTGGECCGTVFSLSTGLGPFVAFVRNSGKVGQTGGILGKGFIGTTSVSLNGTPASFTVVSDTFIKATIPAGATTGYVTVTIPSGTLTSNVPFHVIP